MLMHASVLATVVVAAVVITIVIVVTFLQESLISLRREVLLTIVKPLITGLELPVVWAEDSE